MPGFHAPTSATYDWAEAADLSLTEFRTYFALRALRSDPRMRGNDIRTMAADGSAIRGNPTCCR
ncbi:hypothetical protein BU197_06440 [Streptomyces sp. CBMA291]|nr:hypothetical protein [Streptomyces sp. CBMA291]MBD0715856.1 hypothetical protein [Streptomyces sp. CBMA370]